MSRSNKLVLEAPYSKITKMLWQDKKNNSQQEKQNLKLKTRLNYLANNASNKPSSFHLNKIQQKYERLIEKVNEQKKWIASTMSMVEERKYQELKGQVNRLQIRLSKATRKAIESEKKLSKYQQKVSKMQAPSSVLPSHEQNKYISPFYELENEKEEMLLLINSKQRQSQQIERQNKVLNKEIIELLSIKNQLKNQVSKSKMNQTKFSYCRNVHNLNHD